jgi:methionine-rich copper-binding protein CopC
MHTTHKYFTQLMWGSAAVLLTLVAGCNSDDKTDQVIVPEIVPTIIASNPSDLAVNVAINQQITVTFSEDMDGQTINDASFIVKDPSETIVIGAVSYNETSRTAVFAANSDFTHNTLYQASITADVKNAAGIALTSGFSWSFTTSALPDVIAPQVVSNYPADLAQNFALNRSVTTEFSEAVDPKTVSGSSFTLNDGTSLVEGVVSVQGSTASFNPNDNLAANTLYTATLTTAISDLAIPANALAANFSWSFTTSAAAALGPDPVNLRTAGDFVILTKSGITNIPASAITGNIGASPITAAAMDNVFCDEISGTIFGADAAYTGSGAITCFAGTAVDNTLVANAVLDMGTAYNDAAGRTLPDATELGAGDISGMTLEPGLYKWSSGVLISTDVTLSGSANDVWIFQIADDLTQAAATRINLQGGAQAKNIFWQVAGGTGVALDTTAHFEGVILAEKGITLNTDATVNGRLMAQTAVTLDHNKVTQPAE